MIKPYLIPSESQEVQTVEVSTGVSEEKYNQAVKAYNQMKAKAEQLQATRTANKQLIQELKEWQVPQTMQREYKDGKYIYIKDSRKRTTKNGVWGLEGEENALLVKIRD